MKPHRALAMIAVALAAAFALAPRLGLLPVWIGPREDAVRGAREFAGGGGGAVLLVPDADPRVRSFSRGDWCYSWINFLQQEFGPFTVRTLGDSIPSPDETPFAVLPRSLASSAPGRLLEWVGAGGTLIVECPGEPWRDALGTVGGEPSRGVAEIRAAGLEAPLFAYIVAHPLERAVGNAFAWDADGMPLMWTRPLGAGALVGLSVDLGASLMAMQQGIPAEDFRVRNRFQHRHADLVETSDLVADERFLDNRDPCADRLEQILGQALDEILPRPRLWLFPDAAVGLLLMTHDDEAFGDRSRWMTEHEAGLGVVSTSLFLHGKRLSRDGLESMAADGTEVGLHWNLLPRAGATYSAYRFAGIEWVRRRHSLAEQRAWLEALLPAEAEVRACRTHYLLWGPDYGSCFRALAASGFQIDSSYGVDFEDRGYLFGTGRPFQALDRNGLPLPVWELPHVLAEDIAATPAWLDSLLLESERTTHQAITVLFHPDAMGWRPSVGLYRFWKDSYSLARARDHDVATLSETADFWKRRIAGSVRISRPGGAGGGRFCFHVTAQGDGHALALPATWGGRPLTVAGQETRLIREGRRETILVRVPAGESTVEVIVGGG